MILQETLGITVAVMGIVSFPIVAVANTYTLTAEGEQLVFEAAPELGYVIGGNFSSPYFEVKIKGRQRHVGILPELVIRVKPNVEMEEIHALCRSMNLAIIKPMEFTTQEYLLEVLGLDVDAVFAAVNKLNTQALVEWAWPNILYKPILSGQAPSGGPVPDRQMLAGVQVQGANNPGVFPNDQYFPEQWYLHNTGQVCMYGSGGTPNADINATEAWKITTGDPNVVIAVFDTGVDSKHPDLVNNLLPGYDFWEYDDLPDPSPEVSLDNANYAHGTACAGLIAAMGNNNIGVTGVTWNCGIMPIRRSCIMADGQEIEVSEADTATAFRWAAFHGADILSNSWLQAIPQPILHSAILDIIKPGGLGRNGKGCVVLFAAGNSETGLGFWPALYPEVITVGATDHDDIRWYYSNYGPELDIVAPSGGLVAEDIPGGFQFSTDISGAYGVNDKGMSWVYGPILDLDMDYRVFGGTSGACPVAAGVAALMLSVEPNLTNEEVRHFLTRSAKDLGAPGRDDYYGWGRVDARAALDMVLAKRADLDNDWRVDLDDLVTLIESWGTDDPWADIAPATKRDGVVDDQDLELMMRYWNVEIPEMDAG